MTSNVTGPELDSLVKEAKAWYMAERKFLIDALLSGGYPYGAVQLSQAEQVAKFNSMTDVDWQTLRATLLNILKGDADASAKADKAISSYTSSMRSYNSILRQSNPASSQLGAI